MWKGILLPRERWFHGRFLCGVYIERVDRSNRVLSLRLFLWNFETLFGFHFFRCLNWPQLKFPPGPWVGSWSEAALEHCCHQGRLWRAKSGIYVSWLVVVTIVMISHDWLLFFWYGKDKTKRWFDGHTFGKPWGAHLPGIWSHLISFCTHIIGHLPVIPSYIHLHPSVTGVTTTRTLQN